MTLLRPLNPIIERKSPTVGEIERRERRELTTEALQRIPVLFAPNNAITTNFGRPGQLIRGRRPRTGD